ncbi:hypothetical protein, partial [Thermogutta sp.]|uniref:hypothetical protein n=1 Tax=Thermogutta sp. TaxID=1962930 RepID=UPI0025F972E5
MMKSRTRYCFHTGGMDLSLFLIFILCCGAPILGSEKDSGYRGIWFTLGQKTEWGDKYSGGLGTYTAN